MMEKIKAFFANKRELDFYARWSVRLFILIGVLYLVFFKDTSTKTVFTENKPIERVIVLEHIINESIKKDSIIQLRYYEIPDYSNASADSLQRYIARKIKR